MEWLKFAHIMFIIIALGLTEGQALYVVWAVRDRDVPGLRRYARWSRSSEAWGTGAFLVALVFGFAAALAGQFDLLAPWLVLSYALVAVSIVLLVVVGGPWQRRIETALEASPDDRLSDDLAAQLRSPAAATIRYGLPIIMVAVIFLMVTKPALWGG